MAYYTCQIGGIGPFQAQSFAWAPQHAESTVGTGTPTPTSAMISDVTISKLSDENTSSLVQASAAGTPLDTAVVTVSQASGGITYQFVNVLITDFRSSYDRGSGTSYDSFGLNFKSVIIDYFNADAVSGA